MTVFRRSKSKATARRWACLGFLISWLALVSRAQPYGPVIILIGVPGSGRAAQATILKKERGMAMISADDLIARNQQAFEKFKYPAIQGTEPPLDPALNGLVEEAISSIDLSKGLILAGYPATKTQADFLVSLREKLKLPKALVIHLNVPDRVARKRLKEEKVPDIEQQLVNYHRELDFARVYFPQADIHDIDGNRKPAAVAKDIRKLLAQ